ncbi:Uncharacterised protein [Mycobacteroides abscessus subsp. abscessus]|nr:Uncharacterised protein [Mycobacteroides abscessus subsp. abscessus]
MRNHGRIEAADHTGPLPTTLRIDTEFDAVTEQDLHSHTDAQHRAPPGEPDIDDAFAVDTTQSLHTRREGSHTGDHQTVSVECRTGVGGHRNIGANPFQCTLCGPQIA